MTFEIISYKTFYKLGNVFKNNDFNIRIVGGFFTPTS